MPDSDLPFRGDAPSRSRASYGAQEMIAEAQRLIDMPRPAPGPALVEWYLRAWHVGDLTTIAIATLREDGP